MRFCVCNGHGIETLHIPNFLFLFTYDTILIRLEPLWQILSTI